MTINDGSEVVYNVDYSLIHIDLNCVLQRKLQKTYPNIW